MTARAIVVGVDGSASSAEALRWAVRQGRLTGQPVHAVTSWDFPLDYGVGNIDGVDWEGNGRAILHDSVREALGPDGGEQVTELLGKGPPAHVLLQAAAGADLLVVGSRGHREVTGVLLGSVSEHVVTHASCPVVVVHEVRDAVPGPVSRT